MAVNTGNTSPKWQSALWLALATIGGIFCIGMADGAIAGQTDRQILGKSPGIPGEMELAHFDLFPHSHSRRRLSLRERLDNKPRRTLRKKSRKKAIQTPINATWYPTTPSKDPIQIIVSLPEQTLTVYKGDQALTTSRISSGKPGYDTPVGVFSILHKKRHHRSNIYSNAPMPFMQRLTWTGIALHESDSVPDQPASHGCVRLPRGFARELYGFTQTGGHVVIANETVAPVEISHDNLFRPSLPAPLDFDLATAEAQSETRSTNATSVKNPNFPLRILITRHVGRGQILEVQNLLQSLSYDPGELDGYMGPNTAGAIQQFQFANGLKSDGLVSDEFLDRLYEVAGKQRPGNGRLYVRVNRQTVLESDVHIKGEDSLGSHILTAQHFADDATSARWLAVTLTKGYDEKPAPLEKDRQIAGASADISTLLPNVSTVEQALSRIDIPVEVRFRINEMLTPGSSLAITNDGISKETGESDTDFIILM